MDQKISDLTEQTAPEGGEFFENIISPFSSGTNRKIKLFNRTALALTDAASMALTTDLHTLTTSSATRAFTYTYTGNDICILVTLNAASSTFTFPAGSLCISEGTSSGDNTCGLAGTSGDRYAIAIKKFGAVYVVVCKNIDQ